MTLPLRVVVLTRRYRPTHGLCPACDGAMDASGCRVVSVAICAPSDGPAPALAPDHHELRALIRANPYVMDVECHGAPCSCQRGAA